ncbi:MAG: hypothetical protein Q4P20_04440 [Eubacteriales bacterium]|nr:hypothetical protein [Eubacteriales bacterium]
MTRSLRKNIFREIRGTWKRFLSIAMMALLGAGFFAGINASSVDMQLSCDRYLDGQNCFDLEVLSTLGLTEDDVAAALEVKGISDAVGIYSENVLVSIGDSDEKVKLLSIPEDSSINALYLLEGEMAQKANECVVPQSLLDITGKQIGDTLSITETLDVDEEEESSFRYTDLTITGVIQSPLYVYASSGSNERSTGAVADFMYVPQSNITEDYFTELYLTVDGAADLNAFEEEYENLIDNAEVRVKAIADVREQARYDQLTGEANAEIDDAQAELDDKTAEGEQKLADAQKEIDDAQRKIDDGRAELKTSRVKAERQFAEAQDEIDSGEASLRKARQQYRTQAAAANKKREELTAQRKTVAAQLAEAQQQRPEVAQTAAQLEEQRTPLADAVAQYQQAIDALTAQLEEAQAIRKQLEDAQTGQEQPEKAQADQEQPEPGGMDIAELDAQIEQLTAAIAQTQAEQAGYAEQLAQLDEGLAQAQAGLAQIDDGIAQAQSGIAQIDDGIAQIDSGLSSGKAQLNAAEKKLSSAKRQLANARAEAYAQLRDAARELDDGQAEVDDGKEELIVQRADFDKQIADAQKEIEDARAKVGDINKPTWYVLTRDGNSGLSSFQQDSSNLKILGVTFPLIFFLVAVLISLSSMTRMVEEQRGLIGTLQALGYSGGQIAAKYLIYAATASISGAIIGELICFRVIPVVIWNIYRSFYHIGTFYTPFDPFYGTVGLVACAGCIIVATGAACWKSVRQTPAHLMRPKAPNPGKRILLEHITPLWKRFNFSQKVTLRNLFRYKKRFLMTVCGIAGCAALVTTGFGLRDSIVALLPLQFDNVMHYDTLAVTDTELSQEEFTELYDMLQADTAVADCMEIRAESVKIVTSNGGTKELNLLVPQEPAAFPSYISLLDMETEEELTLSGDEVMLTQQVADILGIQAGDTISLRREDGTKADVTVGAIVHNYLSHYVFLSPEGYEAAYQEPAESNAFMLNTADISETESDAFTTSLNRDDRFTSISSTRAGKEAVRDNLALLDQVVMILIGAAAALAIVVLYNLSNINISERIRELATIKVLGFYDIEVYQYNTRENIVLTLLGTVIGLFGGRWLTSFILKTMEMQGIVFEPTVAWKSYLLSAVITLVFATLINFITYFSLKKINMVEALKSVE